MTMQVRSLSIQCTATTSQGRENWKDYLFGHIELADEVNSVRFSLNTEECAHILSKLKIDSSHELDNLRKMVIA